MGAWGFESFENDDALDWIYEVETASDLSVIADAFTAVLSDDVEYLEAPECSMAIAASEVVAALLGRPSANLPESLAKWTIGKATPSSALVKMTLAALDVIIDESELKELWEEADTFDQWKAAVQNVRDRVVGE